MAVSNSNDLREMKEAIASLTTSINSLNQRVEVGFAQVDTKISDLRGEMNTQFAEVKGELRVIKGEIDVLQKSREFWEFVKKGVLSGLIVTVVGGLLLAGWKLLIFGKPV